MQRLPNAHVATDAGPNIEISAERVRRDLARYHAFLAAELRPIAAALTLRQALLIVDAVNGLDSADQLVEARHLAAEIAKLITMGSSEVWLTEGRTLLGMIRGWTSGQRLAVIDAAERFWALPEDIAGPYEDDLRKVGLLCRLPGKGYSSRIGFTH